MAISKAFVQKTLKKHFPKLNDGLTFCDYKHSPSNPTYSASSGAVTDTVITYSNIKVVFADFSLTKTQSSYEGNDQDSIISIDKKGIVLTSELPIIPKKDDIIINNATLTEYTILGFNIDPYNGAYIIHLRPSKEV